LTFTPHLFIVAAMDQIAALKRAENHLGSQTALARAIGLVPQVVNNWHRRGNVPAEYCPLIERATDGAVRCEHLRPDVDWPFLRATDCPIQKAA
jgi:DNA-binding transcriptional regulator YdaS (Cro superfamily)